jgi:cardiolipin synthase
MNTTEVRVSSQAALVEHLGQLPNRLTATRLLLVPVLWALALSQQPFYLGLGVAVACLTDALDGIVARKWNLVSDFGARFDSLADNILAPSAIIWLLMLRPELTRDHPHGLLIAISLYLSSMAVGLLKFRRFGNLHLYSSKAAGVMMFLFAAYTFMTEGYSDWLFIPTLLAFCLSSLETLLLQLHCDLVNAHMGSILLVLLKGSQQ